jgi:hypothetical protein
MSAAHPPQTERAAALHPERRVGDADLGVVVTARRCGHEEANTLPIEEGVELRPLLGGEGPEAPSQAELELVAEPFPVHVAEATVVSLADEEANGGALLGGGRRRLAGQRLQVAIGELLDEKCGDDSRQIGAGLPTTVWSRSRISTATSPSLRAMGPIFPTWASPQIHTCGPWGSARPSRVSSHS